MKKCVDHILLKSLTTNVDLRMSSPTLQDVLGGKEDFRTYHQTMNSSSLAITMFRNTQRTDRRSTRKKIWSNSSIQLSYIKRLLPIWIETSHHPRHHTTRKDTTTHSSLLLVTATATKMTPSPMAHTLETDKTLDVKREEEPRWRLVIPCQKRYSSRFIK